MMRRALLLSLLAAGTAFAQGTFPFRMLVNQSGFTVTIANNGAVSFNSNGDAQTARVTATYAGAGEVTISQTPLVVGSTAFRVTLGQALPLKIQPSGSFTFDIEYRPSSATQANATMTLPFVEVIPPVVAGGQPTTLTNSFSLLLQGTSPSIVLSYVLSTDQNVVPLQPGGLIPFTPTRVGTTAQATLNITNTGNGAGTVTGITITGAQFRLAGLPLFPVSIPGGQALQVAVLYTPTSTAAASGQVTVSFSATSSSTIRLEGTGTAPSLVYDILDSDPPLRVAPGETIAIPGAAVGRTGSVLMRITNSGNADATLTAIAVAGTGFQITNAPVLPRVLAPDAVVTLTVSFTATAVGPATGVLVVNADTFPLSSNGLGSRLEYSYTVGGNTVIISAANPAVVFSPVAISQSARIVLTIRNTGTAAATIANIGVGQSTSPFEVEGLPSLPLAIPPDQSLSLTVRFTPAQLGFTSGTLLVDATAIPLSGSGTPPPPLPAFTISGPSGVTAPLAQLPVGLSLASPYPVVITGTLTLGVASGNLPVDPAVQFSTGGRTVPFLIPANTTQARFGSQGNQGTQVGLQTGTVAASMTLSASFATQAGGVDLTPANAPTVQFSVSPGAPVLVNGQVTAEGTNTLTVVVTGYSTTRSLTNMRVQFTPVAGVNVTGTQFTIDVSQVATTWFRGATSQGFGGQFSISVPFTFQGSLADGSAVVNAIAATAVTVNSEAGGSNTLTFTLRQ